jgi:glycosyltransferase involved in cell wall biosynthesis
MVNEKIRLKLQNEATEEFLSRKNHQLKGSDVLVFIPVHNEEKTIATVIEKIKKVCDFDILVVDDGSTDSTNSIAKKVGVEVFEHHNNLGAMAVLSGLTVGHVLKYKYIIKIDGDDQHDASDIPRLYNHAIKSDADIVIGSRHLEKYTSELLSFKYFGMWFCSKLVTVLSGIEITDITSGYKIWNSKAAEICIQAFNKRLFADDSTVFIEECLYAAKKRLKIEEINVIMYPRLYGESKSFSKKKIILFPLNLMRSVWKVLVSN